jgi:exodeoxyribonuclease VII large subunit
MAAPADKRVLSVKELTRYIKMKLESDAVLQGVWVQGEISNFTHHSSGHMYFTLKDKDSRIKCVMFATYNQQLPFRPKEGAKVLACGNVSVYDRDGQYQFYVTQMQPDGIGSLYLAFEALKQRLEQEGLFDPSRKRPIPKFPRAVGVVTSPTGAAVRDILTTLRRRMPSVPVLLYPVLVQGKHAAPSIVRAIERMNELGEVDVLIVGRGGGSLEELWAFNEEIVARSIRASRIPVISAVGHETDFTIADFAADLRAATPTAAAELAVPHHLELRRSLQQFELRLRNGLSNQAKRKRERLHRLLRSPYFMYPRQQLLQPAERLDRMRDRLRHAVLQRLNLERERQMYAERRLAAVNPREQAKLARERLRGMSRRLEQAARAAARDSRQRFLAKTRHLDALSPLKIMQRGYSLVYDEAEARLLRSIRQVQPGDLVKVRLTDGRLDCHVWAIEEAEGSGQNNPRK